jgi:membrane carboxypeptidase/penicillin-binding protein
MQQLLISGEDHRHFRHVGIDIISIGRAIWRRLMGISIEGASTIEQQIVRVITEDFDRTFRRKFREILLALLVSDAIPKMMLPRIYLHIGYYGWRMQGLKCAYKRMRLIGGKVTLNQAAAIVARLKYPEPRYPSDMRREKIKMRQKHLLRLHKIHLESGVYEPTQYKTIRSRSNTSTTSNQIS